MPAMRMLAARARCPDCGWTVVLKLRVPDVVTEWDPERDYFHYARQCPSCGSARVEMTQPSMWERMSPAEGVRRLLHRLRGTYPTPPG